MAKYEPPVVPTTAPGGRLQPPPTKPKTSTIAPIKPLAPLKPATAAEIKTDVEQRQKKKREEETFEWSDLGGALSPWSNLKVFGQLVTAAPGAMVGLATGLAKPVIGTDEDANLAERTIGRAAALIGINETSKFLGEGIVNTVRGKNIDAAIKSVKRGETPLPYLLEDIGNIALVAGGAGAAAKGASAAARSAATKATLESVGDRLLATARVADTISDAPITLPAYGVGKGVDVAGRWGRASATRLRNEANAIEAREPLSPKINQLRNTANKRESWYGKDIFTEGVSRTIANKAFRITSRRAVRRAEAARSAVAREMIRIVDEPALANEINPETGEAYGSLSPAEQQAVIATLNGRAQLIRDLAGRLQRTPGQVAELGRFNSIPEYSLSAEGAELAVNYLNGAVDAATRARLDNAAERLSDAIEQNTELARYGYGRRRPLGNNYDIPLPEPQALARRLRQAGRTDDAIALEELMEQGYFDPLLVRQGPEDRINFNDPNVQDALLYLQTALEKAPAEVALDVSIYPPKERPNVAFYARIREGLLGQAGTTIGGTPPTPGFPRGRLTPLDEPPGTGIPLEASYTEVNAPGSLSRFPARLINLSLKQLEKLRGRSRQLGEKIVQIELSIRSLEFKVIKANLRIEGLVGYYTDANGNRVSPDEDGIYPPNSKFVPGLIAKYEQRRDAARAELERMRAEQADSTVIDGKVVSAAEVEQIAVEAADAVQAIEIGIAELEAEVDATITEMEALETAQADAANAVEDLGDDADALIAAAAADADNMNGDPEAFLQGDADIAARDAALADREAAAAKYEEARLAELDAIEARDAAQQAFQEALRQQGAAAAPQAAAAAPALTLDRIVAELEASIPDGGSTTAEVKRIAALGDTTYTPPTEVKKTTKNLNDLTKGNAFGLTDKGRGAIVTEIDGELWYTNTYVLAQLPDDSLLATKLREQGLGQGVYRTAAASKADIGKSPLVETGQPVPNTKNLITAAIKDSKNTPPSTIIGANRLAKDFDLVIAEAPDGTIFGFDARFADAVLGPGRTIHFTAPNKPIVVKVNKQVVALIMPMRGALMPSPGLVVEAAIEGIRDGATRQRIKALAEQGPQLAPVAQVADLDELSRLSNEADAAYGRAQDARIEAEAALRAADGQVVAAESAPRLSPVAETPPTDVFAKEYKAPRVNPAKIERRVMGDGDNKVVRISFTNDTYTNGYPRVGWSFGIYADATVAELKEAISNARSMFTGTNADMGGKGGSVGGKVPGKKHGRVMFDANAHQQSASSRAATATALQALDEFEAALDAGQVDLSPTEAPAPRLAPVEAGQIAAPQQTFVDPELPVFQKTYGKNKRIEVVINDRGLTEIRFEGTRPKDFAYATNGWAVKLRPEATQADVLRGLDAIRRQVEDTTKQGPSGRIVGASAESPVGYNVQRSGGTSKAAVAGQALMREAFADFYAAVERGEVPIRQVSAPARLAPPPQAVQVAARAAKADAVTQAEGALKDAERASQAADDVALEAYVAMREAIDEGGDGADQRLAYDQAVAAANNAKADLQLAQRALRDARGRGGDAIAKNVEDVETVAENNAAIQAQPAPAPTEVISTSAATEADWQKQTDGSFSINTGSRRYAALKVDVTPPGAKKKKNAWTLKRYGSDGEVIEGATQVFPNFKAAREYVQQQIDADGLTTGQRYVYRPGRELGPGPGVETPVSIIAAEQRLARAEATVGSAQQRLENLRGQVEKNTARIDKLRVDEAARRAKLIPITAAATRLEARLGPEFRTQPDTRLFVGQTAGPPSIGQALTPEGAPVAAGEGAPAMLRPVAATIRTADEQIQAVSAAQADAGVPVEQRSREVEVVDKAVNEALLRRRQALPPTLPARVAMGMERQIGQPFLGAQYVPVGRRPELAGGTQLTIEPGLVGDIRTRSERYRTGEAEEVYDIVQIGRLLAGERRQLELNEAFRVLMSSQLAVSPEEILGADRLARLQEQSYEQAWQMGITTFGEEGYGAYAPGVPTRDRQVALKAAELYGAKINKEMEARGFRVVNVQGSIDSAVRASDIEGGTRYLPSYAVDKIRARVAPAESAAANSYLRGTARLTTAFKNLTLPLSVVWQIGDLVGVFWSAAVTGVSPAQMANYMVEMLRENYGGPDATRVDILRNIFKDPQDRRIGELADLLSESGLQDVGLRIQEEQRFRGQRPGEEPQTVPQRLLGRLGAPGRVAGAAFPTFRRGAYRINEAINRVGRHAYFLAKFDKALADYNLQNGTDYTVADVGELGLHERPGPIRDAWEDTIDTANEVMGDWLDLTPFERRYVLPHLTFYAWTKHIHKMFIKVARDNPSAIKWQMYLGALAYDPDADPLELLTSYIQTPGGGLAGTNFINPFGDIVEGPIGTTLIQRDPRKLLSGLSPGPRLLGGLAGFNVARGREISGQYGTGEIGLLGEQLPRMLLFRPTEFAGFAIQQFPLGTKLLDIMPAGQLPGTSIQTGPFERYDTGQARFKPMTSRPVPKFGGRLLTAARLLSLPGVPSTSIEKMKDIERRAQQRLRAFETARKRAEAMND